METDHMTTEQPVELVNYQNGAPKIQLNRIESFWGAGDVRETLANEKDMSINAFSDGSYNRPLHVEVCVSRFNCQNSDSIETQVVEFLRLLGPRHVPTTLLQSNNDFMVLNDSEATVKICEILNSCVDSIKLILDEFDGADGFDTGRSVDLCTVPLIVHVYQLVDGDEALPVDEVIEFGSEKINGGTKWFLPSGEMHGLWESLVFDSDIKLQLLSYAQSALLFADRKVSSSVISWNRVVLLYGPPGTGKTSLCRALANKLAIRMADRYPYTQLIEVNTMNLMSKWFSESARLISKMFANIREYLESPEHLVCLLVDEVESLTAVRSSAMSGCEPSDAIRVVNSVLTEIDHIKRYPNVLILATSNVTGIIDPAFLDRADIRTYVGPPSAPAIYTIYRSCLTELIRVGLIQECEEDRLLSYQALVSMQFVETKTNKLSLDLWHLAEKSVGLNGRTLRKLPLLAHAFHLGKVVTGLKHSSSFTDRIYMSSRLPNPTDSNTKSTTNPRNTVTMHTFIQALHLAVEKQITEIEALDLISSGTSRLASNQAPKRNLIEPV